MTKTQKSKPTAAPAKQLPPTKNKQVIDLLLSEGGATLEDMSTLASWQPHSTRSLMTGMKKKGHVIESYKIDGVRRYRIISTSSA